MESITSDKAFDAFIDSNDTVCVHFAADWCEPCKALDEALIGMKKEYPMVSFVKVDAEEVPEVTEKCKVETVPHIMFFKSGKFGGDVTGAKIEDIKTQLDNLTGSLTDASVPLESRLKTLINKAPVMLFMKGNPEQPRCGFSNTITQILNESGVPYSTFDILANDEVRQGLKKMSDWPTYPQLYVQGELVGGLDIVKELKAGGELESTLRGE